MKYCLQIPFFLFIVNLSAAQTFSWCDSGFSASSSGGTFTNLSNTGVNLTIGGLYDSQCYGWDNSYISTGINNGLEQGVQHVYTFKYSQPVDVQFVIENITYDTTHKHDDFLSFSGLPMFFSEYEVTVSGNTVYRTDPTWTQGGIWVRYNQVDSFSITHGRGIDFNPGFIVIGRLIGSVNSGLESSRDMSFQLFPNPNIGSFMVRNSETETSVMYIYNSSGQLIHQSKLNTEENSIEMPVAAAGIYYYRIISEKSGRVKSGSFCKK